MQECSHNKWEVSPFAHHQGVHMHEYADVLKGVGTLPGGPYHIQLKDSYKPVQHPPRSVPLGMQSAYKAELE